MASFRGFRGAKQVLLNTVNPLRSNGGLALVIKGQPEQANGTLAINFKAVKSDRLCRQRRHHPTQNKLYAYRPAKEWGMLGRKTCWNPVTTTYAATLKLGDGSTVTGILEHVKITDDPRTHSSMCSRAFPILLLCIMGLPLSAPGQTNQTGREGQLDLVGFPYSALPLTVAPVMAPMSLVSGERSRVHGYHIASVGGQFYETTGGYAFHKFLVDIPNLLNSGLRLELDSGYELWDSAWYFGIGNHLPRFSPTDVDERFYTYDSKSIWIVPKLRLPLVEGFWLFTTGLYRRTSISTYRDTLLDSERPTGVEGGSLSQLQIGLMYDKRDREPDTHRGVFAELGPLCASTYGPDYALFGLTRPPALGNLGWGPTHLRISLRA